MKVMFDVDGVLADFSLGFRRLAQSHGSPIEPYSHTDPRHTKWDWPDLTGGDLVRTWATVRVSRRFWLGLPPLVSPDEAARLRRLTLEGILQPVFVTARVGTNVYEQTTGWLRSILLLDDPMVYVTGHKGEMAVALDADYSIEDKAGNAVFISYLTKGRTKSYIVDRPYNQFDPDVLGSKVRRVFSLDEFLDEVEAEA